MTCHFRWAYSLKTPTMFCIWSYYLWFLITPTTTPPPPPRHPSDPKCTHDLEETAVTTSTLSVQWTLPVGGYDSFEVQLDGQMSETVRSDQIPTGEQPSFTFDRLRPGRCTPWASRPLWAAEAWRRWVMCSRVTLKQVSKCLLLHNEILDSFGKYPHFETKMGIIPTFKYFQQSCLRKLSPFLAPLCHYLAHARLWRS